MNLICRLYAAYSDPE